jgi:hypothetical protein
MYSYTFESLLFAVLTDTSFNTAELELTEAQLDTLTLIEIEKYLEQNRKSLKDYPSIPYPQSYVTAQLGNRLIYDEKNYDVNQQKEEFETCFKTLTGMALM